MKIRTVIIVVLVLLVLGEGYRLLKPPQHSSARPEVSAKTEQKPLYQCPMHPQYTSDKPGDCPICGMQLVEVEQEDTSASKPSAHEHGTATEKEEAPVAAATAVPGYAPVKLSTDQQSTMGIVVEEAKVMPLERTILTVGRVAYNETKLHHVHTKFDAYVETLYVNFVGQAVKQGDPLFSVYSPELLSTENEYLLAQRGTKRSESLPGSEISPGSELVSAARQRLALWDVGPDEIARLEKTGKASTSIIIRSPVRGIVTALSARQGMRITPMDTVFDIADLSSVWVLADIYEMDLAFVHADQTAEVTLLAEPGRTRTSKVSYVDPTLDPKTRTVKVRLELDNAAGDLKPEMYANVRIKSSLGTGLAVPDSAVLWTGERRIVFVQRSAGVFEPREVTTGVKVQNYYEIKQGVTPGEKVVTGANFLLDSESKLKASIAEITGGHKH